jgi:hypothetical protein
MRSLIVKRMLKRNSDETSFTKKSAVCILIGICVLSAVVSVGLLKQDLLKAKNIIKLYNGIDII